MEPGTVVITVKEYDKLREFKKEIEKGKFLVLSEYGLSSSIHTKFFTESEAIERFIKKREELQEEINRLEGIVYKRKRELDVLKETIKEIKGFNWWQFRKWKKQ